MVKEKCFVLCSGSEDGWEWQIKSRILRTEGFHYKGKIEMRERRGFLGTYKNKRFMYKERLPEGMVRHHEFYNDDNPNDGIVYVSQSEHAKIHNFERWC